MTLADKALAAATEHQAKFQIALERAAADPMYSALYECWLLATDISHDASPGEMDDCLTEIQDIAAAALGVAHTNHEYVAGRQRGERDGADTSGEFEQDFAYKSEHYVRGYWDGFRQVRAARVQR